MRSVPICQKSVVPLQEQHLECSSSSLHPIYSKANIEVELPSMCLQAPLKRTFFKSIYAPGWRHKAATWLNTIMTWLIFLIIVFFLVIMHLSSHVNECRRILYRLKPNHDKSLWTRIDFPSLHRPHVRYFLINSNHFHSFNNFQFHFNLCKVSIREKKRPKTIWHKMVIFYHLK